MRKKINIIKNIEIVRVSKKYVEEISSLGKSTKELQIDNDVNQYYSASHVLKSSQNKNNVSLIALDNKKLIGFLIINYHDYFDEVYISDIFVKPEYRKRGIATLLLKKGIDIMKKKGRSWVWALVQVENKKMQTLFESIGLKKGKKFYFYYNNNIEKIKV